MSSAAIYDASFCAALILTEIHSQQAKQLFRIFAEGHAPELWHYEIANILIKKHSNNVIGLEELRKAQQFFSLVDMTYHKIANIQAITKTALDFKLSGYDAAYLHLALDLKLPLLTFDKKLSAAAKKAGLPSIDV